MSLIRKIAMGVLAAVALAPCVAAYAKPEFAKKEGVSCVYCHVRPGGPRNYRGLYYGAHNNSFTAFDNEFEAKLAGVKPDTLGEDAVPTNEKYPDSDVTVAPALNFVMKDIDGKIVNLGRYQGKVVLMFNGASFCGHTPQYAGLEKLYMKYKDKGLVLLGFPANQFNQQEPGTDAEIKKFCTTKYAVTFPMFSKIIVKGEGINPLYKFLTSKETDPQFGGDITWNFNKFLLDRNGAVIARFDSKIEPESPDLVKAIEAALAEKAKS